MGSIERIVKTAIMAAVGWCVGWVAGGVGHVIPQPADYPFLAVYTPLPHHVPKYADGVSFRFAMVHDVIHERFSRHGPDHYRERVRNIREKLLGLAPEDTARFALSDDLGAALDRLGNFDEAIAVIREKLARQEAKGLFGRDLYTSYANLGTFLIHGQDHKAASGGEADEARYREGIEFIRKSVEVNPQAHFGREQWQAAIAEFLLAAMKAPALLKTYDCVGNSLALGLEPIMNRKGNWTQTGYGRPFSPAFSQGKVDAEVPAFFKPGARLDDPAQWADFAKIREHITKVGAEPVWEPVDVPSHPVPVPFDEPMLGIIGMWRQGGGANPHFALAMGETMLRVGQRYIAWSAYERAFRLADRYSPNPEMRKFLREHCRKRQAEIEKSLKAESRDVASLRPQFEAELAYGEGYQKDYQGFEAVKIRSGQSIRDELFFHDFPRRDEAIASKSGVEEWYARVPRSKMYLYVQERRMAWAAMGAGLAAIATAGLLQMLSARRASRVVESGADETS